MTVSPQRPPIDEVVVGFFFRDEPRIDAVIAGRYWATRDADFTLHALMDRVMDAPGFADLNDLRTTLVSSDQIWALQLQRDRLYVNWSRRENPTYPGFTRSLMPKMLDEKAQFDRFLETFGVRLVSSGVELAKVDLFLRDTHWRTYGDLAAILPLLAPMLHRLDPLVPGVSVKWEEPYPNGKISVGIDTVANRGDPTKRAVRLETRLRIASIEPSVELLATASAALNSVFGKIVSTDDT